MRREKRSERIFRYKVALLIIVLLALVPSLYMFVYWLAHELANKV